MNRRLPFAVALLVVFGACGGATPDPPMRLVSSVPAEGAVDVDTATALTLRFSKPAVKGSLKVSAAPGPQFGRAYWTEGGAAVTLWAADALFPNSDYTLAIEVEASDGDPLSEGTALRFRTKRAFDIVAPTAELVTPSNGTVSAPRETPIEIRFSEAMAVASVSVGVTPEVAMGPAEWSADLRTLTLRPVALLDWEARISIEVAGEDLAGHALTGAKNFSFMVMGEPDLTAPILVRSEPADGATGVGSMPKATLEFSEAIAEEGLSLALMPAVRASIPQWNDARTVVMFEANEPLPAKTSCQIQFQVQDLAGNVLAGTVDFETGDPPRVVGVTPAQNSMVGAEPIFEVRFSAPMAPETVVLAVSPSVVLAPLQWNAEGDVVQAAVTMPLVHAANYRLSVMGQSATGDKLEGPYAFLFSVAPFPTLYSSTPDHLAQNVLSTSRIHFFFNVPMVPEGFQIDVEREDGVPVAVVDYEWTASDTVDAKLVSPLEAGYVYEARGTGTSVYGDTLAPFSIVFQMLAVSPAWAEVVRFTPAAGASDTPVRQPLVLEFATGMNQLSVQGAFTLDPPATCAWVWATNSKSAACVPTPPLTPGVAYTATLGADAKDLSSRMQRIPFQSQFTTDLADETVAPTLLSADPADGTGAALKTTTLTLRFSEPMDRAATEAAFQATVTPAIGASILVWSVDSTELTWIPYYPYLNEGAEVNWSLSTAATDLAGLPLARAVAGVFRVARVKEVALPPFDSADGFGTVDTAGLVRRGDPNLFLGDDEADDASRAFVTFDLGALTSVPVRVSSAQLDVRFKDTEGPGLLGGVRMVSVNYGPSLSVEDFDGPMNMAAPKPWPKILSSETLYNVLDKVQADLSDPAREMRCQFRFEYMRPTNLDHVRDGKSLVGPNDPTDPSIMLFLKYEYAW